MSGSASDDCYERGLEVRKRVVAAENVERQLDGATELDRDFQSVSHRLH